jgi:hypothetical protein
MEGQERLQLLPVGRQFLGKVQRRVGNHYRIPVPQQMKKIIIRPGGLQLLKRTEAITSNCA